MSDIDVSESLWQADTTSKRRLQRGDTLGSRTHLARYLTAAPEPRGAYDSTVLATLYARLAFLEYRKDSTNYASGFYGAAYPLLPALSDDSLHAAMLTWSGTAARKAGDTLAARRYYLEAWHLSRVRAESLLVRDLDSLLLLLAPGPTSGLPAASDAPWAARIGRWLIVALVMLLVRLLPPLRLSVFAWPRQDRPSISSPSR